MELLMAFLTTTLKKSADDIRSLIYKEDSDELKDDAGALLLELDAQRVSAWDEKLKTAKQEQYDRAKREVSNDFEKRIKSTFNLETDKKGDELIAEAVATKIEGGKDGELTDEKIKASNLYQQLQRDKKSEIEKLNGEWETKLTNAQSEFNQQATRQTVKQKAIAIAKSLNLKISNDPIKAEKQLNIIARDLETYNFEANGDDFVVKKENGEQLLDQHGNPVSFSELVEGTAKGYFDVNDKTDDKPGTGTENKNNFGGGNFKNIQVPKDGEELKNALRGAKSPEEREAISNAYIDAQNSD